MPRYVRLGPAAPAPSPESGADWERFLAPAGSLAKTGAGLVGDPDLSAGTGGATGLLSLAQGISSGNPVQALSGAAQTGNAASGYFGGPTIGSLANSGLSALGVPAEALATAGSFASAAALPFALTALAAGYDTHGDDFLSTLFGGTTHAQKKALERKNAPTDFASDIGRLQASANTLGAPGDTLDLLRTAQSGVDTRENLGHTYDILKNHGADMSGIAALTPNLSGDTWQSWTGLMDRAATEGRDTSGIPGLGGDYGQRALDVGFANAAPRTPGDNSLPEVGTGDPGYTTPEANDLSQAIYGRLMREGHPLDGPLPGATGAGGYLAPEQLAEFGMTPGNYEKGITDYIAKMGTLAPWEDPLKKKQGLTSLVDWTGGAGGGDAA